MQRAYTFAIGLFVLPLMHCALLLPQQQQQQQQQPSTQDPAASSETTSAGYTPPQSNNAAPSSQSKSTPATAPKAFVPTTVEIHSDCPKTTPIFYGEKPKFGSGTKSSIGSNTTTSAGRKSDGTLTVWIIDDHENGIASVHVTPSTRRVEIDRSCQSISAR